MQPIRVEVNCVVDWKAGREREERSGFLGAAEDTKGGIRPSVTLCARRPLSSAECRSLEPIATGLAGPFER